MLERLLQRLATTFTAAKLPYMIIGGQAVLFHGHPRLTQDIDITLGVETEALADVMAACRQAGLSLSVNRPEEFVTQTHVLPLRDPESGLRVDLVFANTPYEHAAIRRARGGRIGRATVRFASLEDLIIHKLVAGRPIDLDDVRTLLAKRGRTLDTRYVRRWLRQFAQLDTLGHDPLRTFDEIRRSSR